MTRRRFHARKFVYSGFLSLLASALLHTALAANAQAQNFSTVFSFQNQTDGQPYGGVALDSVGNLYGSGVAKGTPAQGTIYKVDGAGTRTVLAVIDGNPHGTLLRDSAGNLYGTTAQGGNFKSGNVFKVDATGVVTVLHEFTGRPDGANPYAGLTRDLAGDFYGTTFEGGAFGKGTIFKVDAAGNETVLYSFHGKPDAGNPLSGLTIDSAGNLYGTTLNGGTRNFGTIFRLDTSNQLQLLFSFTGLSTGVRPHGELVLDAQTGNLYGTTSGDGDPGDYGNVFKLDLSGQETVLHKFMVSDGKTPYAGLVRDAGGNLYGTTIAGGSIGYGTVFTVIAAGKFKVLHNFGNSDGSLPVGTLALGRSRILYGTTQRGGAFSWGTVFRITP